MTDDATDGVTDEMNRVTGVYTLLHFTAPQKRDSMLDYPAYYDSFTSAKRAAEHHAATGRWNPAFAMIFPAATADPVAEADIAALGAHIVWRLDTLTLWRGRAPFRVPDRGQRRYQVYQESDIPSLRPWKAGYNMRESPNDYQCPCEFANATRAKAACERHYATGKWD